MLALLAFNLGQVRLSASFRPLLIASLGTGALLLLLRWLFGGWRKAAVVCSLAVALFFTYGHVFGSFGEASDLQKHFLLVPIWGVAFGVGIWWVARKLREPSGATFTLNIISILALAFPLFQIMVFQAQALTAQTRLPKAESVLQDLQILDGQPMPDVYFIILDAYTRDDYLQEAYEFDNAPFLESLEEMGFYVARCSQSNYAQTTLSLSSTLNMDYLPAFYDQANQESADLDDLEIFIQQSVVRRQFESLGYSVVAFETDFVPTEILDADLYLARQKDAPSILRGMNLFESMLIETTAGLILMDLAAASPEAIPPNVKAYVVEHRAKVLFTLDGLESIQSVPGPKFVFAHVFAPHPPFVFSPEGEFVFDDDQYSVTGYHDQVAYVNSRVLPLVEKIIAGSETPPIIIIQGDHGGMAKKDYKGGRMAILNAYYLPGEAASNLYPGISPVNSFRLIFSQYFGGSYDLLEDVGYYSSYKEPFTFNVITDTREGCEE